MDYRSLIAVSGVRVPPPELSQSGVAQLVEQEFPLHSLIRSVFMATQMRADSGSGYRLLSAGSEVRILLRPHPDMGRIAQLVEQVETSVSFPSAPFLLASFLC